MSVITGEAVAALRTMDDQQVLQQCVGILRELFKEQVRKPTLLKARQSLLCMWPEQVGLQKGTQGDQGRRPHFFFSWKFPFLHLSTQLSIRATIAQMLRLSSANSRCLAELVSVGFLL